MKNIVLLLLVLLAPNNQSQWVQKSIGTQADLNKVVVIDSLRALAVGGQSTILKTTDAGESWNSITPPNPDTFVSAHFITPLHGIVVGWNTLIKTTNGGNSWFDIPHPRQGVNYSGYAIGSLIILGEENGTIKRTTNSGNTWSTERYGIYPVFNIVFRTGTYIGYYSSVDTVYKTTNWGETWFWENTPAWGRSFLTGLKISKDQSTIFAAGFWGDYPIVPYLMKNYLANDIWESIDHYLPDISFSDIAPLSNELFYVCSQGYIAKSTDGGLSLEIQDVPTNANLKSIDFYNSNLGYAVGTGGTILVTRNGGVTSIGESDLTVNSFSLSQNYPNPFNPSTKIRYTIPLSPPLLKGESEAGGFVTLKVYDVLGNEVATLVNEEQPPGIYEVEFNVGQSAVGGSSPDIASGVYFYRLQAGSPSSGLPAGRQGSGQGFVETKKMIFMK